VNNVEAYKLYMHNMQTAVSIRTFALTGERKHLAVVCHLSSWFIHCFHRRTRKYIHDDDWCNGRGPWRQAWISEVRNSHYHTHYNLRHTLLHSEGRHAGLSRLVIRQTWATFG
jgi:hypothetical protein